ncbi:hypothetical protein ACKI1K_07620 [Streptomyces scabiei]|uniref:hypothetical protein n=1 Tax=Streptomyces scabiei TaxID=1930 RepID=UPI0038F688EB
MLSSLGYPAAVEAWSGIQHCLRRPEDRAVLALAPTPRHAAALSKRRLHDTVAAAGAPGSTSPSSPSPANTPNG